MLKFPADTDNPPDSVNSPIALLEFTPITRVILDVDAKFVIPTPPPKVLNPVTFKALEPFISPKNVLAPLNCCVPLLTTPVVPFAASAIEITGVVVPVATVKPFGLVGLILTLVTVPFELLVPAPIAVLKVAASKALTVLSALNLGNVIADGLVKVNID